MCCLMPRIRVIFINGSSPSDIHLLICLLVRHNASCVIVFIVVELEFVSRAEGHDQISPALEMTETCYLPIKLSKI